MAMYSLTPPPEELSGIAITFSNSLIIHEAHDHHAALNSYTVLRFHFSVFSFVLASIEKIHQTLQTVFDHIRSSSKILRVVFSTFFLVFALI